LLVLEKGESMRPYNLGAGNPITIGQILDGVISATNKNPIVEWDESKPTTIPFRMVNTDRIKSELGFKQEWTFEQGLQETIDWYLGN